MVCLCVCAVSSIAKWWRSKHPFWGIKCSNLVVGHPCYGLFLVRCKFSWKSARCRRRKRGWNLSSVNRAGGECAAGKCRECGASRPRPRAAACPGTAPASSARHPSCRRTKTQWGSRSPVDSQRPENRVTTLILLYALVSAAFTTMFFSTKYSNKTRVLYWHSWSLVEKQSENDVEEDKDLIGK